MAERGLKRTSPRDRRTTRLDRRRDKLLRDMAWHRERLKELYRELSDVELVMERNKLLTGDKNRGTGIGTIGGQYADNYNYDPQW